MLQVFKGLLKAMKCSDCVLHNVELHMRRWRSHMDLNDQLPRFQLTADGGERKKVHSTLNKDWKRVSSKNTACLQAFSRTLKYKYCQLFSVSSTHLTLAIKSSNTLDLLLYYCLLF